MMTKFIFLISIILCTVLLLTLFNYNCFISKKSLQNKLVLINTNKLLLIFIFLMLILFSLLTVNYNLYSNVNTGSIVLNVLPDGVVNDKANMDPVRWWPSGVPQSMTIIGSMLGTFAALTKLGVSPRFRVLGALGAGGVSTSQITYHSAIENSVGFNRFMYGIVEYRQTGKWPSLDKTVNEKDVKSFVEEAVKQADTKVINSTVDEVSKLSSDSSNNGASSFVSDGSNGSDFVLQVIDKIMTNVGSIFQPVPVNGYLDDLLGQQMAIQFILFFVVISLVLLIIAYIINNLLLLNKDYILSRFSPNNKFIQFYLKYQVLSIKFSLIYLPIFIFIGLFTLLHGTHFLITHQIPFEILGIDLHILINSK